MPTVCKLLAHLRDWGYRLCRVVRACALVKMDKTGSTRILRPNYDPQHRERPARSALIRPFQVVNHPCERFPDQLSPLKWWVRLSFSQLMMIERWESGIRSQDINENVERKLMTKVSSERPWDWEGKENTLKQFPRLLLFMLYFVEFPQKNNYCPNESKCLKILHVLPLNFVLPSIRCQMMPCDVYRIEMTSATSEQRKKKSRMEQDVSEPHE